MIDSIHYTSVIFSNRESICIIPGLIKDLAPCKYCVCNPHVLPPSLLQGSISVIIGVCCCTETVAECLSTLQQWMYTQEQLQHNSCGNLLHQVPPAPQKTPSQGTLHSIPGPKKWWDLVKAGLATVLAKILPNPTLPQLLLERTWVKQSPNLNSQAGLFKL